MSQSDSILGRTQDWNWRLLGETDIHQGERVKPT